MYGRLVGDQLLFSGSRSNPSRTIFMRRIGTLPTETQATRFRHYLEGQGIGTRVDTAEGAWEVWIHREDQVDAAREKLAEFTADPQARKFEVAGVRPADPPQKSSAPARRRASGRRELPWNRPLYEQMPVTLILIIASISVYVWMQFNLGRWLVFNELFISQVDSRRMGVYLPEVQQGDVWRLFTPMFVHFGFLHIALNMMATWQLAGSIELGKGSRYLILMTLVIAPASHIAQYLVGGPGFGGMSGVAFGWFGYLWARTLFRTGDFHLPQHVINQMIVFQLICFSGLIGDIANTAHIAGLAAGFIFGGFAPFMRRYDD